MSQFGVTATPGAPLTERPLGRPAIVYAGAVTMYAGAYVAVPTAPCRSYSPGPGATPARRDVPAEPCPVPWPPKENLGVLVLLLGGR